MGSTSLGEAMSATAANVTDLAASSGTSAALTSLGTSLGQACAAGIDSGVTIASAVGSMVGGEAVGACIDDVTTIAGSSSAEELPALCTGSSVPDVPAVSSMTSDSA